MKVGAVEETITVSGETPIVDVQSTRRQTTLSGETINALPTTKSWAAIMVLMPSTDHPGGHVGRRAGDAGHGRLRWRTAAATTRAACSWTV